MIINDLYNNKKQSVSEGMAGKVVFSGTGADGGTYEIIQSSPTDFMIHANGRHIDTYSSLQRAMSVLQNEVPGLQQGVAEGKADPVGSWVVYDGSKVKRFKSREGAKAYAAKNGGKVASSEFYADKIQKQGVAEVSLGDYRKKAAVSRAMAQTNRFFDRDDPAKVTAADQTIAKRERGLARADARVKPYTPPKFDAEKHQRDLTAKYPNIDELVRRAELNRDPDYEMADGQAYYAARDAEQNYQKLKQIQRVIQGLNESLQSTQP